jgi:transporter family protein
MNGMALILAAAVLWGVGSLFAKVAVFTVDPWTTSLVRSAVFFPVVVGFVARGADLEWSADRPAVYALGAGVLTGVSVLSTRLALTAFDVSLVSPLKRLSLLVTVGVSVLLLSETLTRRKVAGVAAAVGGLLLLST